MSRFVRNSKFRHVFGNDLRKDQCYDNVRISRTAVDTLLCAVNPKFIAICTDAAGGGSFLVLPLSKTGRVERDSPQVTGHKAGVIEVKWCPHNDNVIASGSEDCTVKVWQIPDEGLTSDLTEPVVNFTAHQRRVHIIEWHPSAHNIILTGGNEPMIYIWNVGTSEVLAEVAETDVLFSVSLSYDGSQFATTCKDKKIKVYETRTCKLLNTFPGHEGAKPSMVSFLKEGKLLTTGFSRMSERQYGLWDSTSGEKITFEDIDSNNGVLVPFYDPDTNMVYLAGKGDTLIRYYEVDNKIHYLSSYNSKDPQRGICSMPKRGLNVNSCEIARFYKLIHNGLCQVIPFTVPRKSELFQDDLYPDTCGDTPAITADDFIAGKNADPILVSLRDGYIPTENKKLVSKKPNILDAKVAVGKAAVSQTSSNADSTPTAVQAAPVVQAAPAGPALPPEQHMENFDAKKLLQEVAELKELVKEHDKKIASLEEKLASFEGQEDN